MSDRSSPELTQVAVQAGDVVLAGDLAIAQGARALVVFAHGSGSSRLSSRNRHVAGVLNRAGLATLLFDLLTVQEEAIDERTGQFRFDIERLARRLTGTVDWAEQQPLTQKLTIGLFGASTGAAAALMTAAQRPNAVRAVVSRGGRPDLAGGDALEHVAAPTLLIVGGFDLPVIELNQQAAARLAAEHAIEIVPEASHLFEEPGKLDEVARLACDWFTEHLVPRTVESDA